MTYEEFNKEFLNLLHTDLSLSVSECAWQAFGRLNVKNIAAQQTDEEWDFFGDAPALEDDKQLEFDFQKPPTIKKIEKKCDCGGVKARSTCASWCSLK